MRTLESQASAEEEASKLKVLQDRLDQLVAVGGLTSTERDKRVWASSRDRQRLTPGTPEYDAASESLALTSIGDDWSSFGLSIAGKTHEVATELLSRTLLVATAPPTPGYLTIPSGFIPPLQSLKVTTTPRTVVVFRLDDDQPLTAAGFSLVNTSVMTSRHSLQMPSASKEVASGLRTYLDNWAAKKDETVLAAAVNSITKGLESPYTSGSVSMGDQLVDLASRSDMPIVADAFRLPSFSGSVHSRLDSP